ncbi:MAG: NAD(P)/FAD-dependent oxidoreductase, partial [Flavobacteriia bacterium]|nr:NAD(P)/FAD-dependent oxidoreductase [Flavobacteriia bacterium]
MTEIDSSRTSADAHRVVIVGGGAGGLELATRLGDTLARKGRVQVTLVDKNRTHIWKPKLHEIAAGSMDLGLHAVDYLAQAHWHGFHFRLGELHGLDRTRRVVQLRAYRDERGREITPASEVAYDTLVLSIGSLSNDFGTPGVREHAMRLESQADAKAFHSRLINACLRAQMQAGPVQAGQLHVAIIGAGATGVELAAELHRSVREVVSYGLDRIDPARDLKVMLIEAADRILPVLPERLSTATTKLLRDLGVEVLTSARVAEVLADGVRLADGRVLPAELVQEVGRLDARRPDHEFGRQHASISEPHAIGEH